jgi:hypothetical protein
MTTLLGFPTGLPLTIAFGGLWYTGALPDCCTADVCGVGIGGTPSSISYTLAASYVFV